MVAMISLLISSLIEYDFDEVRPKPLERTKLFKSPLRRPPEHEAAPGLECEPDGDVRLSRPGISSSKS